MDVREVCTIDGRRFSSMAGFYDEVERGRDACSSTTFSLNLFLCLPGELCSPGFFLFLLCSSPSPDIIEQTTVRERSWPRHD